MTVLKFTFEAGSWKKKEEKKYGKLSYLAWRGSNISLCKAEDQNMCFREIMTAFRKPWPRLSGMLNAIHPQGYLWRQSPFGICFCFIFLNACIKSAEKKKMKVTPGTSQTLSLCAPCLAVVGCTPCCVCNEWLQFRKPAPSRSLCISVCELGLGRGTVSQGLIQSI